MKTAPCPVCDGEAHEMGVMGSLRWFRCRQCGAEFNKVLRRDGGYLRSQPRGERKNAPAK